MEPASRARSPQGVGQRSKALDGARAEAKSRRAQEGLIQGVLLPPKPEHGVPRIPLDLADIDDPRLMKTFVKLVRFQDYFSGQLVKAEIEERAASHILEVAKAKATILALSSQGKGEKITIAKEEAKFDPEVVLAQDDFTVKHNKVKLMRVLYESVERNANLVSRELTRRVGRRETNESRAHRWGGGG